MKRGSRLSSVLHTLLHMAEMEGPATREAMVQVMQTHPVVVRRLMAGLRSMGSAPWPRAWRRVGAVAPACQQHAVRHLRGAFHRRAG